MVVDKMEKYFAMLAGMGADSVKTINSSTIVTAPWTVYKCQYGCGKYGKSHCCPPKSPDFRKTREIIDCYGKALIFRTHDMSITTDMAVKTARELFLDGYYKAIGFGSGPCQICSKCNPDHCNFPEKTAPSMEACGIDVFQTVRSNGYEITTLKNKNEVQNHFGLVLIE